jgi:hypothetical protein
VKIKLDGVDGVQASYAKYPEAYQRNVRRTLFFFGNKMVKHARGDHEFKRKSGNLDRAIMKTVKKVGMHMRFFISDRMTMTKKGYGYGTVLHEGSGKGYRQSKSAKRLPHKTPKTGYGHLADHFMDRAWDKYISRMKTALVQSLNKTAKKLGMK